jgi:maleamate amidohydrolase
VRKTLPSGFTNIGLQAWLTQRSIRSVIVAGCTTSDCVRATVLDAMNAGFVPLHADMLAAVDAKRTAA